MHLTSSQSDISDLAAAAAAADRSDVVTLTPEAASLKKI